MNCEQRFEVMVANRAEEDERCTMAEFRYTGEEMTGYRFTCDNRIKYDPNGCTLCDSCQKKQLAAEQAADDSAMERYERRR